jgi:uncharacterized membrane protein (UPF0127 family)
MTLPYRNPGGLQVVVFETPQERANGLQHRPVIQDDTLFVFPATPQGSVFHSRNVAEPFEIAFLSSRLVVLSVHRVTPPVQTVVAPPESSMALEAKVGVLPRWGFMPGVDVSF